MPPLHKIDDRSVDELLDVIGSLVVFLDPEGRIVRFNKACETVTGYREDEVVGKVIWDFLIVDEEIKLVRQVFSELQAGRHPSHFENDWKTRDGGRRRIAWTNTVSLAADGSVQYVIGTGVDMTANVEAERALRENRAILQSTIDSCIDGIVSIDADGTIQSFNPAAERIFMYGAGEVIGRNVSMLMPSSERAAHHGYLRHYLDTGEKKIIGIGREVTGVRKDGSSFPMELGVGEVLLGDRHLFTGFIRDVSQREAAEAGRVEAERLRNLSEQRLAEAIDAIPMGFVLCDADGKVVLVNNRMRELRYWQSDLLVPGAHFEDLLRDSAAKGVFEGEPEREAARLEQRLQQVRARQPMQVEQQRVDGSWVLAVEHYTRDGELIALRLDITDIKNAQAALHERDERLRELQMEFTHVSRLSAMGEMAATLAHELNQPLTAVMNYVQAARRLLNAPDADIDRTTELMSKGADQAQRAGDIIRRLRSFVARGESERLPEDINEVVREACALALVGARSDGIDVDMDMDESLPPVLIDRVQIQQVLVNLIRNSVDAMMDQDERAIRVQTARNGVDAIEVAIVDNGPGLAADIAENLFEPFNTSKPDGMGIGLTVCRSIIEDHGGRIWSAPESGGGADFRFTVPLRQKMSDDHDG